MNLEIKEAGDARKIVNVSFDLDEMSEKGNQVCKELSRIANIPGFRKGKAPEQVIRKKYATEIIQELNRKVSTAAYEAVLENKDIKVYSILKVDAGDVQLGIPATVEVTVDIEPDFELPKYEEFELTTHPTEVKDEEVDKELDSLRDQRASFEEVERAIVEGDYVKCSYEGMLDGSPVAELLPDKPMYGKQTNTWEEAGQAKGLGVDAIAQAVIGMKKEEKKEVDADFAKDFEVAPLAGKKVVYSLEIHEVREKKAPAVDDEEFLKALKVENVDDLKKKIKDDLLSRKERENIDGKRSQVTQKFLEIPDFPLPQQAVEDESKSIFQSNIQRAVQQGAKQEDMESKRDELWNEAQVQGKARVKITIALSRIAELEKIEVSNEDLAQAATREAMMMRADPQVYVQELAKDQARISRLRQDVLHDKTLELVASKAKEKVCEIDGEHSH
ncbi:trigger factor [Candidatus Seribacter sulfatis]|uniref:trigger factor n=1 Tax=Candidatus Seribacter sulfatis TaxID=3381756 RepID=UPI00389A37D4